MKRVCFVNGSPRGKKSGSQYLINETSALLDKNTVEVEEVCIVDSLRSGSQKPDFEKLIAADSIIFVFPLYIDSIPSSMLDFLYQFEDHLKNEKQGFLDGEKIPDIYAIINCGFIEGRQNINAMHIIQHFSVSANLNWRFGIGIGAGEFMRESQKDIPMNSRIKRKIYQALVKMKEDIEKSGITLEKNIFTNPTLPKCMFTLMGDLHWIRMAGKNRVKRKALYARPLIGQ